MNKEDVAYAYNRLLPSHKKNEILPSTETWIDIKSDKQRQILYNTIICRN